MYFIEFPAEGEVRLANGDNEREGRVEIFHDNSWGRVCNDGFTEVDAAVVCVQLGFHDAVAAVAEKGQFGLGEGYMWLDDVTCDGSESQLSECAHPGWGELNICGLHDAGVICRQGELIN